MIREYIHEAMKRAHYEPVEQRGASFVGTIPPLRGVMAVGETLEECRASLEDALDGWIALGLKLGHDIPPVSGIDLIPVCVLIAT